MSDRYSDARPAQPLAALLRGVALCALVVCALTVMLGGTAAAQSGYSAFGRRFIVAFPDTTISRVRVLYNTLEPSVSLSLFSLDTARVTVSAPGFLRTVTVFPERSTTVDLTSAPKIFVDSLSTPLPTSFEVRSDRPIAATAYFVTIHGAESFTPLPVEQWGSEYFAASLNQWFVYNAIATEEKYTFVPAPAALLVVASEENTEVTIASPTPVVGPTTRTVTLDAGEVYLVETAVPARLDSLAKPDLSGTRITATKPVGVISGNTRTLGSTTNPIPAEPLPTNSMSNTAYEWLHPVADHGHTFIYRQFSAVDEVESTELIRVYGTSPGLTTVTTTNGGPPMSLPQGEYLEFSSKAWRPSNELQPFAVRTDRPAQAFVTTGATARLVGNNPADGTEMETHTWSPAMAELVPRERWITLGRYNAPLYPGGTTHYVIVAADSGTTVLLDGEPIAFDSAAVTGTSYRHARIVVPSGDHTLRSTGGRFTATAFGQRRGYAAFLPFRARGDGDPTDGIAAAHPTYYLEILALSYAHPVPGISTHVPLDDSLQIARLERCDSTVVTANRTSVSWSSSILDATEDAGGANVDIEITKTFINRLHLGFRIRFRPVDPTRDASGGVTITNDAGQRWSIPYTYRAQTVEFAPGSVELLAVPVDETRSTILTLTNRKPFTTTVLDVRLTSGSQGFSLRGREVLPKPLASGGSVTLTLDFASSDPGRHHADTLVIIADCDSTLLPLSAWTAPPDPAPIPLITGYDWEVRRTGSANDTLSFITNAGTLPFTVDRVEILDDAAGAFALVAPDVVSLPEIEPAARHPIGIRFLPPTSGTFIAELLLITRDGDSARAELRGRALTSELGLDDLVADELCIGRALDTAVSLVLRGELAARLDSFIVSAPPSVRIELDTAWMGLPRTLGPGEQLTLRMRLVGLVAGAFDATVVAVSDAGGDSVARISGAVTACVTPGVRSTDHDFDTVLVSLLRGGSVDVVNTGEGEVTVEEIRIVDDAEGSFRVIGPPAPFVIAQGGAVAVDVAFMPATEGPKSARVEFTTSAGIVYSSLRGVGARMVVPAFIPRDYRAQPGAMKSIAVVLERPAYVASSGPIAVEVGYDPALLDFVALRDTARPRGSLRFISSAPGRVMFEITPMGDSLLPGPIAALDMLVRITLEDSTELPLAMTTSAPWLTFETRPGLLVRDPFCGLAERLFEFTQGALVLRPVRPMPVRGDAVIEFSVPIDGAVTLTVIDAIGSERLRLVDAPMTAGAYALPLPGGTLPSGIYLLRLATSGMERVERFVVE